MGSIFNPPKPPAPPPPVQPNDAEVRALEDEAARKRRERALRGRTATIATSPLGITGEDAPINRPSLLGE